MRAVITSLLVALCSVVASAQLPVDLGALARKLPSLDGMLRGKPLTTDFDDTVRQQPVLDRKEDRRKAGSLRSLARTAGGGFVLRRGLWEGTFESYCLSPGTYAPGKGDGFLHAPVKGARATAIRAILAASARHPEVVRGDVQMLLWGILSRTRIGSMPPRLQAAARVLLPANEIRAIDASGLELLAIAERTRLFGGLAAPIRQTLEVESDLRYEFSRATVTYDEVERIAVLSGVAPEDNSKAIRRGQWSRHPRGYYIRYFPDSFSSTRVEILVPDRVVVTRDRLNRIIAIEDSRGGKTETAYNDAVPPRSHPKDPRLKAYAFKTIRFTRRGTSRPPEVHEIHDEGWTFHRSQPRTRRVMDKPEGVSLPAPMMSVVRASLRMADLMGFEMRQDWFDRWSDRAERAQDIHDRYEFYRDRADSATDDPSAESVDEVEDTDHYRDGIEAATTGDVSDRLEWIIEHQERENGALEWAISVLEGLPTTSTTEDPPPWEPGDGIAVPSGGGQRLGISGR